MYRQEKLQLLASMLIEINDLLIGRGCRVKTTSSKNGYLVSYIVKSTKKTIANIVTRKSGNRIRIYAENVASYED